MFGMPVLKLGKKPICGREPDGINFKLDPLSDIYSQTMQLDDVHLFSPTLKNGRTMTMKNWVVVPFVYQDRFLDLAAESIRVVEAEMNAKR